MSDDASKRAPMVSVIDEMAAEFRSLQAKYAAACDRIVAQSNLLSRAAERAKPAPELANLLATVTAFGDAYRGVMPPYTALLELAMACCEYADCVYAKEASADAHSPT